MIFFSSEDISANEFVWFSGLKIGSYPNPFSPCFFSKIAPLQIPSKRKLASFIFKETAVLNWAFLFDLFFKLRDDYNCSVVIVTHNENNANICDRKLLIIDGKIKK